MLKEYLKFKRAVKNFIDKNKNNLADPSQFAELLDTYTPLPEECIQIKEDVYSGKYTDALNMNQQYFKSCSNARITRDVSLAEEYERELVQYVEDMYSITLMQLIDLPMFFRLLI